MGPKHLACASCAQPAMLDCGRCDDASYCSRDCQKTHWSHSHKNSCVILPEHFIPEDETHITLTREALGVLVGSEVDHHKWMLVSALRGTSSFGCEPGTQHLPDNAHGEKPYNLCTIERDELKAFMAAYGKYLGNTEWNALVSAMEFATRYEHDVEKAYSDHFGVGTGMPGSMHDKRYKEFLASKGITFKSPADVVRDVLEQTPIPPHFMGKYSN